MIDQSNYNFSTTVSHVTGALLHCLREFEGITQTSLAEKTGMSTSGLSKLEKGETNISIEQIFILGGQFKLKSSEFMVLLEDSIELINKKGILVNLSQELLSPNNFKRNRSRRVFNRLKKTQWIFNFFILRN